MKHCYLLLLLVGLVMPSMAQDSVRLARKEHRAAVREELLAQPRSMITLGIGVPPSIFGQTTIPRPERVWSPMVGVSYAYRVWQFLEVGGSLGYSYSAKREQMAGATWSEHHTVLVSAFARYAWFNSRWVSLYSSLGVFTGIEWGVQDEKRYTAVGLVPNYPVLPEVSPIGVRVGRRFFGYLEPLCFNGRGFFLQGGFGYKF